VGIIAIVKRYDAFAGTSLAILVSLGALTGCGSDEKSSSTTATQETYLQVPAATVTEGIGDTIALMTRLAAAPTTMTDAQRTQVQSMWLSYEGTVKTNDANSYLAFEDALAGFDDAAKAKDGTKMATQVTDFSSTAAAYLAKFPG
jgi:homoserine acetyltransferase